MIYLYALNSVEKEEMGHHFGESLTLKMSHEKPHKDGMCRNEGSFKMIKGI